MPAIRIKPEDKERLDFMRGLIPSTQFFTLLLDNYEQPKEKPIKEKKKTHPQFQSIKDIYFEYWEKNNGFEYTSWSVVDASATNRLIAQLEKINQSDCTISGFFQIIMSKLPDFYKNKTINAINKNLNGIIADIKNGGNKGTKLHQDGGIFDHRK